MILDSNCPVWVCTCVRAYKPQTVDRIEQLSLNIAHTVFTTIPYHDWVFVCLLISNTAGNNAHCIARFMCYVRTQRTIYPYSIQLRCHLTEPRSVLFSLRSHLFLFSLYFSSMFFVCSMESQKNLFKESILAKRKRRSERASSTVVLAIVSLCTAHTIKSQSWFR